MEPFHNRPDPVSNPVSSDLSEGSDLNEVITYLATLFVAITIHIAYIA